jgi:hypothetical protein
MTLSLDWVSGQRHAPAAFYPRGKDPGTHSTGGWVGPRAGLGPTQIVLCMSQEIPMLSE